MISSLSYSIVSLYFFALIAEECFLVSPCCSLELCFQMHQSLFQWVSSSLEVAFLMFSKSWDLNCVFRLIYIDHWWKEKDTCCVSAFSCFSLKIYPFSKCAYLIPLWTIWWLSIQRECALIGDLQMLPNHNSVRWTYNRTLGTIADGWSHMRLRNVR